MKKANLLFHLELFLIDENAKQSDIEYLGYRLIEEIQCLKSKFIIFHKYNYYTIIIL